MGAAIPPDPQIIASIVAQATRWRRCQNQDDDQYRHFTDAALAEQVCGVELRAVALADG